MEEGEGELASERRASALPLTAIGHDHDPYLSPCAHISLAQPEHPSTLATPPFFVHQANQHASLDRTTPCTLSHLADTLTSPAERRADNSIPSSTSSAYKRRRPPQADELDSFARKLPLTLTATVPPCRAVPLANGVAACPLARSWSTTTMDRASAYKTPTRAPHFAHSSLHSPPHTSTTLSCTTRAMLSLC